MQHPKVVVIGAGSLFFGRQAIWQMVNSPHLQNGTLAMVDTDTSRLSMLKDVAQKLVAHKKSPLAIEAHADHKKALEGADFVVLSFARDSVHWRGLECEVSAKHGIRMCSGDTIGPGGIFRTMRELPTILSICDDIQKICPDAWVINYINPSTTNGMAIHRYAPKLKSFALCDGLHMPHIKRGYAIRGGIVENAEAYTPQVEKDFDMVIAGPNHFTWMLKAEYKGKNIMPDIAESLRKKATTEDAVMDKGGAKQYLNNKISYELYQVYGLVPTCVSHTKEYVRFWQGNAPLNSDIPQLKLWETEDRIKQHDGMWKGMKEYADGSKPIEEFDKQFGPDHATDIIESMAGDLKKPFFINTLNKGAITNMADDAFVELLCDVDMNGPRPRPVGDMPRGLRSSMEQILDTHELTAQAAATYDHAALRKAMITDPLTCSIPQCDAIIKELLEAERDALSPKWFA